MAMMSKRRMRPLPPHHHHHHHINILQHNTSVHTTTPERTNIGPSLALLGDAELGAEPGLEVVASLGGRQHGQEVLNLLMMTTMTMKIRSLWHWRDGRRRKRRSGAYLVLGELGDPHVVLRDEGLVAGDGREGVLELHERRGIGGDRHHVVHELIKVHLGTCDKCKC
jgi:hypothetical protein